MVLPFRRKNVPLSCQDGGERPPLWVGPVEEGEGDVEIIAEGPQIEGRLGNHCMPRVKVQVLIVGGPRARVEVEEEMVLSSVPVRECPWRRQLQDIFVTQSVPVQRVPAGHEHTRIVGCGEYF